MTGRRVQPGDVSRWAREIVAKRALILLGVAGVLHVVVLTGAVPTGFSEQAEAWTASVIDAIAAIGAVFWIRTGTTPADPKLAPTSTNGVPLVEAPALDPDGHVRKVARAELEEQVVGHLPPPGEHRRTR